MDSTDIYHHSDEQLLGILQKCVNAAYQEIAALDLNSNDDEIAFAILALGQSLHAYRLFTDRVPKNLKIFD
ncbi:MAG TPA: hypothetical protein VIF82_03430 [Burkholderiaceae bacterium]|jgi:hypothetical protein